jgi:hypothetical protein
VGKKRSVGDGMEGEPLVSAGLGMGESRGRRFGLSFSQSPVRKVEHAEASEVKMLEMWRFTVAELMKNPGE